MLSQNFALVPESVAHIQASLVCDPGLKSQLRNRKNQWLLRPSCNSRSAHLLSGSISILLDSLTIVDC